MLVPIRPLYGDWLPAPRESFFASNDRWIITDYGSFWAADTPKGRIKAQGPLRLIEAAKNAHAKWIIIE